MDKDELFSLFNLSIPITLSDLKKAKKKVLMLHPDKNIGVPDIKDIYLKYLHAYKKLEFVMEHIIKSNEVTNVTKASDQLSVDMKKNNDINSAFSKFVSANDLQGKDYANAFNEMFNTVYVKDDDDGYDDWMKSKEDMYDVDDIEKSRKTLLQNTVSIIDPGVYKSSGLYNDLKEAYKTTILDVDEDAFMKNKQSFKSEAEYRQYREQVMEGAYISEKESQRILDEQGDIDSQNMIRQAFEYKQKQEIYEARMKKYESNFLKLE